LFGYAGFSSAGTYLTSSPAAPSFLSAFLVESKFFMEDLALSNLSSQSLAGCLSVKTL
jgi:hypothetical protein